MYEPEGERQSKGDRVREKRERIMGGESVCVSKRGREKATESEAGERERKRERERVTRG